jgi:hypothetical protein
MDNCLDCLYSKDTEISIFINDLMDSNNMICSHENSPYYNEYVTSSKCCRLFLNTNKYFLQKDRKEKLDNLKRKI